MKKQAAADYALGIVGDAMVVEGVPEDKCEDKGYGSRAYLSERKAESKYSGYYDDDLGEEKKPQGR